MKFKELILSMFGIACLMAFMLKTPAKDDVPDSLQHTVRTKSASKHLFAVPIHNRIGFIDSTRALVVEPVYENAQEFSEGLCAVRINGLYGFIDLTGEMVIKPVYDYATKFKNGLALVY